MESAHSIRFLYQHFLAVITEKSLNTFYHACSYAKADYSRFMNVTAKMALHLIPEQLKSQPVFLCIDDTIISKFGTKFENVSKLFDHATHNGCNYLNGHCFVSLMLCVPVWNRDKISYLAVPLGYRMWQKKESKLVKYLLIGISILFLFVMLVLPLFVVVTEALKKGWQVYVEAVTDSFTIAALMLTLKATVIAVLCNTVLGLCAAWAVTRFQFKGKKFLTTLIDVPVTVSPIIAGLIYLLVFGKQSILYPYLQKANIQIVFAVPGIILATVFVTFPFVFRELLPVLESIGTDEEEAAALMGAKGWTIFSKITFPHIKWALLYGIVLCTARAMGEFGAVSVLSGHLRGLTNTLPLHVEILFNEFQYVPAFAVSSILVILAVILLIARNVLEHKGKGEKGDVR